MFAQLNDSTEILKVSRVYPRLSITPPRYLVYPLGPDSRYVLLQLIVDIIDCYCLY